MTRTNGRSSSVSIGFPLRPRWRCLTPLSRSPCFVCQYCVRGNDMCEITFKSCPPTFRSIVVRPDPGNILKSGVLHGVSVLWSKVVKNLSAGSSRFSYPHVVPPGQFSLVLRTCLIGLVLFPSIVCCRQAKSWAGLSEKTTWKSC